jgi:hypothetical protein
VERPHLLAALLASLLLPSLAEAQHVTPGPNPPSLFGPAAISRALGPIARVRFEREDTARDRDQDPRDCLGCPKRRLLAPYLGSVGLNVMYNGINHLRGHHTARVGFNSWWHNLKHGFEWDDNPWLVNQIGHPYQGNNYYTAGRANGLTFWEASSVAAFGSASWEFFAENNRASLNDLVNTTLGGIAVGEVLYRVAWLVRNPAQDGKGRRKRELIAMGIDPMTGLTRLLSGDMMRVSETPASLIPSSVSTRGTAGVLWQGSNAHEARSTVRPFVDMDFFYGDVRTGRSRVPYGAFTAQLTAGGGAAVSHAAIRGRLYSRPFGDNDAYQLTLFQTFDFIMNRAYDFGAQGFEAEIATTRSRAGPSALRLAATFGANALAAVDSLLPPPPGAVLDPDQLDRRRYDYGPGARYGAFIEYHRAGRPVAAISYRGYQISVVDGARSNHVLQRLHLDAQVPVSRRLALGGAAEFFYRKVYVWPIGTRTDESPQFRIYLAWRQP